MVKKSELIVVFDLDDTLYKEIDFLKSAYKAISNFLSISANQPSELLFRDMLHAYNKGLNAFDHVINKYQINEVNTIGLIGLYRNHKPQICLTPAIKKLLVGLKESTHKVCLITDGRSIQQRNKIEALGLSKYFDTVIISEEFGSEKPHINNYKYVETQYGLTKKYIYIGDNTRKDFITPNRLGWHTICLLDNGQNIHKQSFSLDEKERPHFIIKELMDLTELIDQIH